MKNDNKGDAPVSVQDQRIAQINARFKLKADLACQDYGSRARSGKPMSYGVLRANLAAIDRDCKQAIAALGVDGATQTTTSALASLQPTPQGFMVDAPRPGAAAEVVAIRRKGWPKGITKAEMAARRAAAAAGRNAVPTARETAAAQSPAIPRPVAESAAKPESHPVPAAKPAAVIRKVVEVPSIRPVAARHVAPPAKVVELPPANFSMKDCIASARSLRNQLRRDLVDAAKKIVADIPNAVLDSTVGRDELNRRAREVCNRRIVQLNVAQALIGERVASWSQTNLVPLLETKDRLLGTIGHRAAERQLDQIHAWIKGAQAQAAGIGQNVDACWSAIVAQFHGGLRSELLHIERLAPKGAPVADELEVEEEGDAA